MEHDSGVLLLVYSSTQGKISDEDDMNLKKNAKNMPTKKAETRNNDLRC